MKTTIQKLLTPHIPHKSIGTCFYLPYFKPAIKWKVWCWRVYKKARKCGRKDWKETQKLQKEINQELQQAYANYMNRLLDPEEDKPGGHQVLLPLHQAPPPRIQVGVSTLKAGGRIRATAEEKANACNAQLQLAFSTEDQPPCLNQCWM